jgi:hypothetical protein
MRHSGGVPTSSSNIITASVIKKPRVFPGTYVSMFQAVLTLIMFAMSVGSVEALPYIVIPVYLCFFATLLFLGCYWSFCLFRISAAFAYTSDPSRRFKRAWASVLSFFFHPLLLALAVYIVHGLAQIDLTYGLMNSIERSITWIVAIAVLTVPCFTTIWFYRFVRKLISIVNLDQDTPSFRSQLPALGIATCHFFPMLFAVVGIILVSLGISLHWTPPTSDFYGRSMICFSIVFLTAPICQAIAFAILSSLLKRIHAKIPSDSKQSTNKS